MKQQQPAAVEYPTNYAAAARTQLRAYDKEKALDVAESVIRF